MPVLAVAVGVPEAGAGIHTSAASLPSHLDPEAEMPCVKAKVLLC